MSLLNMKPFSCSPFLQSFFSFLNSKALQATLQLVPLHFPNPDVCSSLSPGPQCFARAVCCCLSLIRATEPNSSGKLSVLSEKCPCTSPGGSGYGLIPAQRPSSPALHLSPALEMAAPMASLEPLNGWIIPGAPSS